MLIGCILVLMPAIVAAMQTPADSYDISRRWTQTAYSDAFFAFTAYMHVGPGKLIGFAGMLAGFSAVAVVTKLSKKNQPSAHGPHFREGPIS
jgi:hypothetical protein